MKYSCIETTLYNKRDLNIKMTVSNKFKTYDSIKHYTKDSMIKLMYKPINGIIIGSKKSSINNILLPLEEFSTFLKCLKQLNKALKLEDMFILDKDNKLVLNKKLSLENQKVLVSYGSSLIIRTAVVNIDSKEYEGIEMIFNKKVVIGISYIELKKMYKYLKKIDVANYALASSIFGYAVTKDDSSEYVEPDENNKNGDYFKSSDNNRGVLESHKTKGDRGKLWDMT